MGECGKPEQCAFEEVLELSDKDGVNAQKIYDTYARQCWDTSVETGCNPQGTFLCINKWNDKKCVCRVGWKNGECSEDIDECLLEKEGAGKVHCTGAKEICQNSMGSFECGCETGYDRESDKCVDIDECQEADVCGSGGNCKNLDGNFYCECKSGFLTDLSGKCTVDQDECAEDVHDCDRETQTCVNENGGFKCLENPTTTEFITTTTEVLTTTTEFLTTTTEAPQLLLNPVNCGPGYRNIEAEGSGLEDQCEDIDECNEFCGRPSDDEVHCHEPVCGANSKCTNTVGSFSCERTCDDEECPKFSSCNGKGECECEGNTLDTSKYSVQHEKLTDKCISNIMEQIEFMNFYLEKEGNDEPRFITGQDSTCPKGFKVEEDHWSKKLQCVDIDECDADDGKSPCLSSGCVNYFGGFNCIVDLEEENQLCHHSAVTPYKTKMVNGFEYPTCRCYPGYKLCEDQWTCTCMCKTCGRKRRSLNVITSKYGFKKHNPADRFSLNEPFKKINRKAPVLMKSSMGPSGINKCPQGQIEITIATPRETACYQVFDKESDRVTFEEAINKCDEIGGELAYITSRQEWWNVMRAVSNGWFSFWISENSLEQPPMTTNGQDGTQIKLLNTYKFDKYLNGGVVANLPNDYRMVPPQWNVVDSRQKHRFVCEM